MFKDILKKQNLFIGSAFLVLITFAGFFYYQKKLKPSFVSAEIYFTGQTYGKIKSCGCSLQDLGGIHRRANYLSNRTPESLLLDYGNFFSDKLVNPAENKLYSDLSQKLRFNAINASFKNPSFTPPDGFNLVSIHSKDAGIPPSRTLTLNNISFWITGVHLDSQEENKKVIAAIAKRPAKSIPVILSSLEVQKGISLLKSIPEPVLMIGENFMTPDSYNIQIGDSIFTSGGDRGRYITHLKIEAYFRGNTLNKLTTLSSRMEPIDKTYESGPQGDAMLEEISEWEKTNGPLPEEYSH